MSEPERLLAPGNRQRVLRYLLRREGQAAPLADLTPAAPNPPVEVEPEFGLSPPALPEEQR